MEGIQVELSASLIALKKNEQAFAGKSARAASANSASSTRPVRADQNVALPSLKPQCLILSVDKVVS